MIDISSVRFHDPSELERQVIQRERRKEHILFGALYAGLLGFVLFCGIISQAWGFSIVLAAIILTGLIADLLHYRKLPQAGVCCGTIEHVRVSKNRKVKHNKRSTHKKYHFTVSLDDTGETVQEFRAINCVHGQRNSQHVMICRFSEKNGYSYGVYSF